MLLESHTLTFIQLFKETKIIRYSLDFFASHLQRCRFVLEGNGTTPKGIGKRNDTSSVQMDANPDTGFWNA